MNSSDASLEHRVDAALAEYLRRLDAGQRLTIDEYLRECAADLEDFLRPVLETAQLVESMAGPEVVSPMDAPTVSLEDDRGSVMDSRGPDSTKPFGVEAGADCLAIEDPHEMRVVGDYELLELIGRGGMGMVYKARQLSLDRIVAVKMILGGRFASSEDIARFYAEAQAAGKVDHPNIVTIYQVGEIEGRHYFSMDYVEGTDLSQLCLKGPMEARQAATYLKIVADAVHAAHEQGVLHRDLKPANILIDACDRPYVTDFGLAKHVEVDHGLTNTGTAMGTPSYMPPEQAAGKWSDVGPASDVYSLGAILYAMLTGQPPFRAQSSVDTLLEVMHREPVSPRTLHQYVDRELETICLKCLRKNPSERYSSAKELANDLGRYLQGQPIHARRRSLLERSARWTLDIPIIAALAGRHVTSPTRAHSRAQAAIILGVIILAVLSVFSFRLTGLLAQRMPARVRIAAGRPGGMYFAFTQALQTQLQETAARPVDIVETSGSLENSRELSEGRVDLAWLQAGAVNDDRIRIIALGYYEYIHVIARRDRGWRTIRDVAGHRVALGELGSGSRMTAEVLLRFYALNVQKSDQGLVGFKTDSSIDAAILTIGLDSRDMRALLESGDFELLDVPDAGDIPDRTLEVARISRDSYPHGVANPRGVETLRTPAFLVTQHTAPDRLVRSALEALYRLQHPLLIPRSTAATYTFLPWHPAARRFYSE